MTRLFMGMLVCCLSGLLMGQGTNSVDRYLYPVLFANKLVEFGKAPGGSYDPICFDLKRRKAGDCPILRVDHESVLIDGQVQVVGSPQALWL